MRRLVSVPLGVLAAATLVVTPVLAGSAAAAPGKAPAKSAAASSAAKKPAAKPAKPAAKPAPNRNVKAKVVLVGTVTATQTVTTEGSATSSVLVTIKVQGGDKEYKGLTRTVLVTKDTVVKRNHGKKARYELRTGDKVTVHARRAADRSLTATYIAASGRPAAPAPVVTAPPATSTATTTATTQP